MGATRGTKGNTGTGRPVGVGIFSSRRWLVGGALGGLLLVAAACGSSSASPARTTTSAPASAVLTVSAMPNGSLGTILVDQSGQVLYRFAPDGTGKTTCTGACATAWPPLTAPTASVHLTGKGGVSSSELGTITRPGGVLQVTFKGMPLYRFAGDTQPGQAKGQGVEGTWFVVSPTAAAQAATAPAAAQPAATTVPPPATMVPVTSAPAAVTPTTARAATPTPTTTPAPPPTAAPTTTPPTTPSPATTAPPTAYGY
jgi:predicted lipoprotein with Yx(FWY)xxD motif